jgi:hypothetical protein
LWRSPDLAVVPFRKAAGMPYSLVECSEADKSSYLR